MNTAMPAITHAHIIGQVQQEPGTGHDRPPTEKKNKKNKKNKAIGVLGLASLAFFAVAGSPAGSEDTIAAAGPRLGLAGFLLMPLVWSIPEAMITAELATAFPHNGGYVVWVTEAFGERLGYQEGLLKWVSGTLDNAVYPVMMLNYVMKITTAFDSDVAQMAFPIAVVVVLSTAQATGLQIVGVASTVLIVLTLLPFVVMIVMGLPKVEPSRLIVEREEPVAWALFLTNLFWNLNYWDSVSTIAAEVKNPAQTFPRALMLAIVLTVLMYVLTLGVAIGTAEEGHNWDSSELADAGAWIAASYTGSGSGEWLKIWIVISVAISAAGLYLAEISTDIFMLEGMAELGMLPKALAYKNRFGTPWIALLVQSALVLVYITACGDMETIIAWEMVSYCLAQVLEFAAFIRLRTTHPDIDRPFKSPGGLWGSVALVTPATIFTLVLVSVSSWEVWAAGGVQIVITYVVSTLLMWAHRRYPGMFMESTLRNVTQKQPDDETDCDDELLSLLLS